jgi:pimeloyl-ACP methyl ester carboxylesterase
VLRTKLGPLTRDLGDGRVAWRADALHRTQSPVPFLTAGFLACARRIPVPVLYVSGGPDGFHVTDEEERLSAFAKLTRVTLPTAGHMMHWTEPDALCDSLLSFWAARD